MGPTCLSRVRTRTRLGIVHLSQQLGIPVDVVFLWRHKAKAAFPGKTGGLSSVAEIEIGELG